MTKTTRPIGPNQAFVRPCILLALSQSPQHGYALKTMFSELGMSDVGLNQVYNVLRSLEGTGLVVSEMDPTRTGPMRRIYALTDKGVSMRDTWIAVFRHLLPHSPNRCANPLP